MSCGALMLVFIVFAFPVINAFESQRALRVRKLEKRDSSSSIGFRNYCYSLPCRNGGLCINTRYSFHCYCPPGFTGSVCESNIDDCADNPCGEYGHCTDKVNGYECRCSPGFNGTKCEIDEDDCFDKPCGDHGQCLDVINGFVCKCDLGFSGELCDIDINDCASSPCENSGICQDDVNSFNCSCDGTGFTGKLCECNIDDCATNPCGENGRCMDEVSGFDCTCNDGWTGTNCDTDINDCASNPCGGNGGCIDELSGFRCICADAFIGTRCEIACDLPLDIVVAVGGADSEEIFNDLTNPTANSVQFFVLLPDARNIGAVSFGAVMGDVVNVTDQLAPLQFGIRNLAYPGSGVNTRLAIEEAQKLLETQGRPAVPDVMIVIIGGNTTTGGDPVPAAAEAKSKGTNIYTIGSKNTDFEELRLIASADSQVKIEPFPAYIHFFFRELSFQICNGRM